MTATVNFRQFGAWAVSIHILGRVFILAAIVCASMPGCAYVPITNYAPGGHASLTGDDHLTADRMDVKQANEPRLMNEATGARVQIQPSLR